MAEYDFRFLSVQNGSLKCKNAITDVNNFPALLVRRNGILTNENSVVLLTAEHSPWQSIVNKPRRTSYMVKVEIKLRHTRTKVEIKLRHTREIQSQRISLTNIRNFNRTFSSENVKKRILILSPRQENWEMVNSPSHSTSGFKRIFWILGDRSGHSYNYNLI